MPALPPRREDRGHSPARRTRPAAIPQIQRMYAPPNARRSIHSLCRQADMPRQSTLERRSPLRRRNASSIFANNTAEKASFHHRSLATSVLLPRRASFSPFGKTPTKRKQALRTADFHSIPQRTFRSNKPHAHRRIHSLLCPCKFCRSKRGESAPRRHIRTRYAQNSCGTSGGTKSPCGR